MWAAIFPGQGSQMPGMGKFLFDEFKVVKETFEEASDTLGIKFRALCFNGGEAELALTENTQPCLLLVSTATHRVLQTEFGFKPAFAAGHSVGEFAAVVSAGAMPFADGMRAVRVRGEAMQSAVPVGRGGMTAVMGLTPTQVENLCAWAERGAKDSPVQPANLNAPGQIVISGKKTILDWMATNFKPEVLPDAGRVKFIALKVSAPFHCAMMEPAQKVMSTVLNEIEFKNADVPVIQNVSAQPETVAVTLRENLIRQVSAPVRWIESVEALALAGVDRVIECGPGRVLGGLVKKISPAIKPWHMNSMEDLKLIETELRGNAS